MNAIQQRWSSYLFAAPFLMVFATFVLGPIAYGLVLSVLRYDLTAPSARTFIGLGNYTEALSDRFFWRAAVVTVGYVLIISPVTIVLATVLAIWINTVPGKLQHALRLGAFVPTVLTVSVAALLWRWMLHNDFGVINAMLSPIGLERPWLTSPFWAYAGICLMTVWWSLGVPVVILLAGLQNIPDTLYEAAMVDGASGPRVVVSITLPVLWPVIVLATTVNVIATFQIFGQTYLVTGGGPELSTRPLMQYIYEIGFGSYRIGYASAMSWLLFVLIAAFVVVQRWVSRGRDR